MPIEMSCPECGTAYRIPEAAVGKKVKCRSCGHAIDVPPAESHDPWDDESTIDSEEPETQPPARTRSLPGPKVRGSAERKSRGERHPARASRAESDGPPWWVWLGLGTAALLIVSLGAFLAMRSGGGSDPGTSTAAAGESQEPEAADPFRASGEEAETGDAPYLAASRPFLTAVAARDYDKVFQTLSSHALASAQPHQFFPQPESATPPPPLTNLTVEQFREWMGKMEIALGRPRQISHLYVESHDPEILAGKGDPLEVMLAVGAMPSSIPAEIRKASVRAQILCDLGDGQAAQLAAERGVSEEQARQQFEAENKAAGDEGLYLNVKFVLVEDGGELKVGYFEFMPPSLLD